ncbi:hypothetical protein ES703_100158 [subsurface metagenome]
MSKLSIDKGGEKGEKKIQSGTANPSNGSRDIPFSPTGWSGAFFAIGIGYRFGVLKMGIKES